jgi:hypothetical protein
MQTLERVLADLYQKLGRLPFESAIGQDLPRPDELQRLMGAAPVTPTQARPSMTNARSQRGDRTRDAVSARSGLCRYNDGRVQPFRSVQSVPTYVAIGRDATQGAQRRERVAAEPRRSPYPAQGSAACLSSTCAKRPPLTSTWRRSGPPSAQVTVKDKAIFLPSVRRPGQRRRSPGARGLGVLADDCSNPELENRPCSPSTVTYRAGRQPLSRLDAQTPGLL